MEGDEEKGLAAKRLIIASTLAALYQQGVSKRERERGTREVPSPM